MKPPLKCYRRPARIVRSLCRAKEATSWQLPMAPVAWVGRQARCASLVDLSAPDDDEVGVVFNHRPTDTSTPFSCRCARNFGTTSLPTSCFTCTRRTTAGYGRASCGRTSASTSGSKPSCGNWCITIRCTGRLRAVTDRHRQYELARMRAMAIDMPAPTPLWSSGNCRLIAERSLEGATSVASAHGN